LLEEHRNILYVTGLRNDAQSPIPTYNIIN
jgi:hypothetical protein